MSNIKKIIGAIALASVTIGTVGAEYDVNTTGATSVKYNDNGYQEVVLDSGLEFEAQRDGHIIKMNWDNYNDSSFAYYKIMRSTNNDNPVYPDQSAIRVIDNNDNNELKLENWSDDDAYYRVCVITKERARYCSNVVKLEGFDKEAYNAEKKAAYEEKMAANKEAAAEKKEEYERKKAEYKAQAEEKRKLYEEKKANISDKVSDAKKTTYVKKVALKKRISKSLEGKANKAIDNFIKKVDSRFDTVNQKVAALQKVSERLESLAAKNDKYATLVDHMVERISKKLTSYQEEDISEIEDILNDF